MASGHMWAHQAVGRDPPRSSEIRRDFTRVGPPGKTYVLRARPGLRVSARASESLRESPSFSERASPASSPRLCQAWGLPEAPDFVVFSKKALLGGYYYKEAFQPPQGRHVLGTAEERHRPGFSLAWSLAHCRIPHLQHVDGRHDEAAPLPRRPRGGRARGAASARCEHRCGADAHSRGREGAPPQMLGIHTAASPASSQTLGPARVCARVRVHRRKLLVHAPFLASTR